MNLISVKSGIYNTEVKMLSRDEEIALRDTEIVKNSVEAVRNGNQEMKCRNYYRVSQARIPEGEDSVVIRCSQNVTSNYKVMLDFDLHGGGQELYETKIKPHLEEYGVLHVELSANYGLHTTVRILDGLTQFETIQFFSELMGVVFDTSYTSLSQATYLVPNSDVLYVNDSYWETCVEPNTQLDTSAFKAKIEAEQKVKLASKAKFVAPVASSFASTNATDLESQVEEVVSRLEADHQDPCAEYNEWILLAFALHAGLGEAGYKYFVRISNLWSRGVNDPAFVLYHWNHTADVRDVTIATFFWLTMWDRWIY